MAKTNKRDNVQTYPEEREGKTKDANRKLRAELRRLKKKMTRLEGENKTLQRSFDKSCQYIDEKIENKTLEQVLKDIREFDYKETENGRKKSKKQEDNMSDNCPKCGKTNKEGFAVMSFATFEILKCACGFRTRNNKGEGISRS